VTRRARPEEQEIILAAALERTRRAAPRAVVVCDLDSTLLDNRPRLARVLQDYGRTAGLPELVDARPEHWQGWSLEGALRRAGLDAALVAEHAAPARRYLAEWFFTSAYCRLDVPVPGAAAFVRALVACGALLAYVSGRPRAMEPGTRETFRAHGFPMPDGHRVHLHLKPERELSDDDWKLEAARRVDRLGLVVAAFDNEPLHVNTYAELWPCAMVVHVDTDHSERPIEVLQRIPSIRDFTRGDPNPHPNLNPASRLPCSGSRGP
jgi:beta-phosphoglucomutase-like phosphatase (HAD superfamily)